MKNLFLVAPLLALASCSPRVQTQTVQTQTVQAQTSPTAEAMTTAQASYLTPSIEQGKANPVLSAIKELSAQGGLTFNQKSWQAGDIEGNQLVLQSAPVGEGKAASFIVIVSDKIIVDTTVSGNTTTVLATYSTGNQAAVQTLFHKLGERFKTVN